MKTRMTTRHTGPQTRAEYERTIDQIATLSVRARLLNAKMDRKLQAIRDEHGPALQQTLDQLDALLTVAEAYACEHRDELFAGGRKSGSTTLAEYGLRLGQPTLKPLNRRWTWAKVLEAVKAGMPGRFLRVKEELDKDGLRAQLGGDAATLATVGLRIEQSEAFWVEPKDGGEEAGA